ncbi:glucosaminidase domain-containing protein [Pseudoneobacillus sp. C159]
MIPKNPIMGTNQVSSQQMIQFVKRVNPEFNAAIAEQFLTISQRYGVRGDVAFCQSILETNWFRFGGDVRSEQNNYAGIGASGGGRQGAFFSTIAEGITAHIQHLYAYATKAPLPSGEKVVDPRFHLVVRGSAPNWEDLAGKWAYPGYNTSKYQSLEEAFQVNDTYGQRIITMYNQLKGATVEPVDPNAWKMEGINWLFEQGFLTNERWKNQINEPLPLWAEGLVLMRMFNKLNGR